MRTSLVQAIATTSLTTEGDPEKLARALFCLGYRRSIFRMQEVLDVLRACRSRIDALTARLPQFSTLLAGFQVPPELERRLLGLPVADDPPNLPKIYSKSSEQFLFTLPSGCRWDDDKQKLFYASGEEVSLDRL